MAGMPESEVIVLSGPSIPLRRLVDELGAVAADLPGTRLPESIGALRSAQDGSSCNLSCSTVWWHCPRIEATAIPALRQVAERLEWSVEFRIGIVDASDEPPADILQEKASREPVPNSAVAFFSAIGVLAGTWYSAQVLHRFTSSSNWLLAAGIGALWAMISAVLLKCSRRVGVAAQLLVYGALLFLTVLDWGAAPMVLTMTFAVVLALGFAIMLIFIRRLKSPAHTLDRFEAFRWHVDRVRGAGGQRDTA